MYKYQYFDGCSYTKTGTIASYNTSKVFIIMFRHAICANNLNKTSAYLMAATVVDILSGEVVCARFVAVYMRIHIS